MTDIDPSTVEAKKAYSENGHCKLNNLICDDGDCRQCSFVTDGSLMIRRKDIDGGLASAVSGFRSIS